ncbi:unnamed protein product [Protopolystoma xenopodis]|uniref:PDZ domain-containing protein n=1 Tax=Protopolystoma xenopodis TaxID=117903 RepID=A0A3S5BYG2_9PLAT|nr:unnamed protein product [Protopolystoma xenopodis]
MHLFALRKGGIRANRTGLGGRKIMGLFVEKVYANSPAGNCSLISKGDQILKVNDEDICILSHAEAVTLINSAGPEILLSIRSLNEAKLVSLDICLLKRETFDEMVTNKRNVVVKQI